MPVSVLLFLDYRQGAGMETLLLGPQGVVLCSSVAISIYVAIYTYVFVYLCLKQSLDDSKCSMNQNFRMSSVWGWKQKMTNCKVHSENRASSKSQSKRSLFQLKYSQISEQVAAFFMRFVFPCVIIAGKSSMAKWTEHCVHPRDTQRETRSCRQAVVKTWEILKETWTRKAFDLPVNAVCNDHGAEMNYFFYFSLESESPPKKPFLKSQQHSTVCLYTQNLTYMVCLEQLYRTTTNFHKVK